MQSKQSREDDFALRRTHLAQLSDQELKDYFWSLANQVILPMVELSKTHTTPSIERSVLLRMGFSSMEAKEIVDQIIKANLISKGAGHVVYQNHLLTGKPLYEAGIALLLPNGFKYVSEFFGGNQ
jgi:D-ornithine 4,5-aminomutase subunit alpha